MGTQNGAHSKKFHEKGQFQKSTGHVITGRSGETWDHMPPMSHLICL